MSLGIGFPDANKRSTGALRRPALWEPRLSCRHPETQDAVCAPPSGPWSDKRVGWLGLCGFWGSGRAHVELGDSRVPPLTARTLVPGLQVRPRAAPGAPALLRGGHGGPERLGEHSPAHLRPLQPGQWGHAGGRAPPTPCLAAREPGLGLCRGPCRVLSGSAQVPSHSPTDGPRGWGPRSGCRQVLLPGKALSWLRMAPSVCPCSLWRDQEHRAVSSDKGAVPSGQGPTLTTSPDPQPLLKAHFQHRLPWGFSLPTGISRATSSL